MYNKSVDKLLHDDLLSIWKVFIWVILSNSMYWSLEMGKLRACHFIFKYTNFNFLTTLLQISIELFRTLWNVMLWIKIHKSIIYAFKRQICQQEYNLNYINLLITKRYRNNSSDCQLLSGVKIKKLIATPVYVCVKST